MSSPQVHLALTHVPVILSLVGVIMLVVAIIKKNETLTHASFYIQLFAGISAVPVFLTGEGAEEAVEFLPGVSENIIEKHEELAMFAFSIVGATAIFALAGLLLYKKPGLLRFIKLLLLLLGLATAGVMIVTAHLGGQVRHTEIRSDAAMQTEKGVNGDIQNNQSEDND